MSTSFKIDHEPSKLKAGFGEVFPIDICQNIMLKCKIIDTNMCVCRHKGIDKCILFFLASCHLFLRLCLNLSIMRRLVCKHRQLGNEVLAKLGLRNEIVGS